MLCALCVFTMSVLAGCANYSGIEEALEKVKIENTLPEASDGEFTSLEEASDAIYEQQIAACKIYAETYDKTYYSQFIGNGKKFKTDKVANICYSYRKELNNEAVTKFYQNIYLIVKNCDDCTNKEAFLKKANTDVENFYDAYNKYLISDNPDEELCKILVNYSERRNILALSFLDRNRQKVYSAATKMIEENSETDENFRFYLNKNNNIISALNDVYNGVPSAYAARISEATATLSKNLLNSLESLTDNERRSLMDQLNLSTPSPSPKPTSTPHPSVSPAPSTDAPIRTAAPTKTPAASQVPIKTAPPVSQPTAQAVQPQISEPEPEPETEPDKPEETEPPSYSFSVNN